MRQLLPCPALPWLVVARRPSSHSSPSLPLAPIRLPRTAPPVVCEGQLAGLPDLADADDNDYGDDDGGSCVLGAYLWTCARGAIVCLVDYCDAYCTRAVRQGGDDDEKAAMLAPANGFCQEICPSPPSHHHQSHPISSRLSSTAYHPSPNDFHHPWRQQSQNLPALQTDDDMAQDRIEPPADLEDRMMMPLGTRSHCLATGDSRAVPVGQVRP